MTQSYSKDVCEKLELLFHNTRVYRPMRRERYEEGTELIYDVESVEDATRASIRVVINKFVGGGFAGQVYRVKLLEINSKGKSINGLDVGGIYAIKILIPPSVRSKWFRDILYRVGFQGPFQLQVNPVAARAGALWQKFIRRGAKIRFGDEKSVVNIYATFVDHHLGSCGEISEWVDGRVWRLEVDDCLDQLKKWKSGKTVDEKNLGSPEYRAKYEFMREFVKLLHDMGGHEFARQYEWATCKSQPNCLKRNETNHNPAIGLTAVDFRAGLALLPFLPMSPGDFKLILNGLFRGSLVQFDRGSIQKLETFIHAHETEFKDMRDMLEELKSCEDVYRNSVPDITHNHFRLFYSAKLWSTLFNSAITGWNVRNIIDDGMTLKLRESRLLTFFFFLIGLIPFFGVLIRKVTGHEGWRQHYASMLTGFDYFRRTLKARAAEKMILWHRAGRINEDRAINIAESGGRFFCHFLLSMITFAGLHRFLTDRKFAKERLAYLFIRPVRLYFNAEIREQWLRDMVNEGQKHDVVSQEDADIILSQIKEPFIQKYLKCLAVHVCTLPVSQIVSVSVAVAFVLMHPELPPDEAWLMGIGIIAFFQVIPISPGSFVRGLYVVYLVIRERNFRDYNVAVFVGFFKYIGYLAFPIQMAYRYPVLARFMAAHWAKEAVHIIPVFGESGALLEHGVFNLFYNRPLTIRRRVRRRAEIRAEINERYWHIALCAVIAAGVFGIMDYVYIQNSGTLPGLKNVWWLTVILPVACGVFITLGFGGAPLGRRIAGAAVCGAISGVLYTAVSAIIGYSFDSSLKLLPVYGLWRIFVFSIVSTFGAVVTELNLPDPDTGPG